MFCPADLGRPYLPLLVASDASASFGFGAAAACFPVDKVRPVARLAEKRGYYGRLDGANLDKWRTLGQPHKLGLSDADFSHLFSVRPREVVDVNVMDAEAFVPLLQWLLRARGRQGHRVVVLLVFSG